MQVGLTKSAQLKYEIWTKNKKNVGPENVSELLFDEKSHITVMVNYTTLMENRELILNM